MISSNRHILLGALAGAKRLRRGVALLACLGILGWTLLAATHWHDPFDGGSSQHEAAECVLCLGTATGATPPGYFILHLLAPSRAMPVDDAAPREPVSVAPSSYQSRAPPAA